MVRAFKHFDQNDSGHLPKRSFINSVLNIGVTNFSQDVLSPQQQLERVFEFYDRTDDGVANYRELARVILDSRRKYSPLIRIELPPSEASRKAEDPKSRPQTNPSSRTQSVRQEMPSTGIDSIVDLIRAQLVKRGLYSPLEFAKCLKV